ncbi:MAG TPA: VPLPA-CTERM sorting domain-containing protein [Deltaproteobacteria bacterium]|nr:VPLPA-CTERM sorting domain-containing protein [Deltaproteobacteria bacterium]
MKNMVIICTVCIFLALTALAKAGTITQDFEDEGQTLGEGGQLLTITGLPGEPTLTFTGAYIAEEGNPPYAFYASSPYVNDEAHSGQYTVTDKKGDSGPITVSFATPVYDLSFYAMDIDYDPWSTSNEILTATVYNASDVALQTITKQNGDPNTGDGVATPVTFSVSGISSLEMWVKVAGGDHHYGGWALDDLSYTPVPIPAAAWLLGSGLIGLVAFRRRKMNS